MTIRGLLLLAAGLLLGGCETYSAPRYGVSVDNVMALKKFAPAQVSVKPFEEAMPFKQACRAAGPITASDQMTFAAYLSKGLSDELKLAGLYDEGGKTVLTGRLDSLAFSSSVGTWDIALTVRSSNGTSLSVQEHYEFATSFVAANACKRVADAFFPAAQNIIQKVINSPTFPAMIKG
jgi:hypothetical protein